MARRSEAWPNGAWPQTWRGLGPARLARSRGGLGGVAPVAGLPRKPGHEVRISNRYPESSERTLGEFRVRFSVEHVAGFLLSAGPGGRGARVSGGQSGR